MIDDQNLSSDTLFFGFVKARCQRSYSFPVTLLLTRLRMCEFNYKPQSCVCNIVLAVPTTTSQRRLYKTQISKRTCV